MAGHGVLRAAWGPGFVGARWIQLRGRGGAASLFENFSAYDATYVALAERLDASLVTADRKLSRAVTRHTVVRLEPIR